LKDLRFLVKTDGRNVPLKLPYPYALRDTDNVNGELQVLEPSGTYLVGDDPLRIPSIGPAKIQTTK